jgi:hypothetical protein
LATDLGLKPKGDPLAAVVGLCQRKVRTYLAEFPCATLNDLLTMVAAKVDTRFVEVSNNRKVEELQQHYIQLGENGFADLAGQLSPDVYAITFRLFNAPRWERKFVSVIDCRDDKRPRAYFSKWHEIAHLLTLTPQMRLKFCRSHAPTTGKDPEEGAMDVIAGELAYLSEMVRRHERGFLSFAAIERLRTKLCPESSRKAATIGFANASQEPCVLLTAELALRKSEAMRAPDLGFLEAPQRTLRAVRASSNMAARRTGLHIPFNMRVPERSVISEVFHHGGSVSAIEDLGWWTSKSGTVLPARRIRVEARRAGDSVEALVTIPKGHL